LARGWQTAAYPTGAGAGVASGATVGTGAGVGAGAGAASAQGQDGHFFFSSGPASVQASGGGVTAAGVHATIVTTASRKTTMVFMVRKALMN